MNFRINRQIRAPKVRLISRDGNQLGVLQIREALALAQNEGLDLVEIAPKAEPPVCKIIDYGKFRYDQTKREKESKKSQHQIKVKEIKLKPNIDDHDFVTKSKRAKGFLEKGHKVKITCMFRGREMAHPQLGKQVVDKMCGILKEVAHIEAAAKMLGRSMICVLAPHSAKVKTSKDKDKSKRKDKTYAKDENQ